MYDTIAEQLRSPVDGDVHRLAALVIAEAERHADTPELQIERLRHHVQKISSAVGYSTDHNDRYRALCLRLLLQEQTLAWYAGGAYAQLRPPDRANLVQRALHDAIGTLTLIASAMTGRNFTPTGGLAMTGAADLMTRADCLAKPVIGADPNSLLAAMAAAEPAYLALMCGEKGLGPRLLSFETAAIGYEDAASRFLVASGFGDPPFDLRTLTMDRLVAMWNDRRFSDGKQNVHLRVLNYVASGMSRSYVDSGQPDDARRAALLHLDVAHRLNTDIEIVRAEFEVAAADEHLSLVRAIDRLQRVLSEERTTRLLSTGSRTARLRIADAMGRLALLYFTQGATAARQEWVDAARAWLDGSGSAQQKAVMKRIGDADIWKNPDTGNGWDATPGRLGIVVPPSRGGRANPADDGASRALFYLSRDINAYVEAQHVPALVRSLARLAAMLLDRSKQLSQKPRPERAAELAQVMRKVDQWRPALRARHLTEPLPDQWLADTKREAMRVAELCWEFADRYCPAAGLSALKTAGRAALQVHNDPGHEQFRKYWQQAAARAHSLGDWRFTVTAELKVAWSWSAAKPPHKPDATLAARRAYGAMRAGFEHLANLYEVTTLLDKEWAVYPARVARAFAQADQQSWEAFAALDFGQGLALSAMRSAQSATLHELVVLQHREQQLFTSIGKDGPADTHQLWDVRRSILRLVREGGSLLLAQSGPGELTELLWELGSDAAIIQLGKTNDDVVVSAARLVDERVVYHTRELGKYAQLRGLMQGMWREINVDPADLTASRDPGPSPESALDLAYSALVEPLRDFLAGATSWHIVAHGDLAGLPIHAIRTPEGRYLIQDVAIGYAPSVKALMAAAAPPDPAAPALVIGRVGEPAAGHEGRNVSRILEHAGISVVTADEDPGVMLNDEPYWRIIHIVAHGESRPFPDALESHLDFGPVRVTAQQVLDSGVHAGLVFINACHLANSSPFGGDLYGFPFAFLASGTPVIAAATPVYRPYAGCFAQDLHQALLAGRTPLDAYAHTVRSFIAGHFRHPVYWAPYFYIGGSGSGR